MVAHLYLGAIALAVFATTVANAAIEVDCTKDIVKVKLRIIAELVPNATRFFLGNCMASKFKILPNGEGDAEFHYRLADCNFKRLIKGKRLIFENQLTYRPFPKGFPPTFVHPILCVYERPSGWQPPFLNSGSGVSEGRGGLVFHMALLNVQLTALAKTNVFPLGSFLPIWAAVEQKSHQPLLLLMEECVATTTPELQPGSQVYPIISNKGCLLDSVRGHSLFLPRSQSSAVILMLQSFKFSLGEEVYIHCKLVAWDPEVFDESKKTCHYKKESLSWELLDDPFQSSVCSCCDSTCKSRSKRGVEWESHSFTPNSVLGPLIITEPSDPKVNNMSGGPVQELTDSVTVLDSSR
ncbi:zona pellucida glycoprotein 3f, tandem duplicate 2 isoform X2 [Anoplopoma fimbria]|uniref:zona pellucida glycoprotein 3f, tandem duplicate 2 isoform X2 n=1 Tax=Anoplopoma fimbria TaxID=229290 RepID=UPI0023EAACD3|nr:zona pellucida glycoprotein 3f, tandem duplicate 2 isoform X2 [Anoplopoma fimbria]